MELNSIVQHQPKRKTVNPIWPMGGGGGGEAESSSADFNLRELCCYLSNTDRILPLLLKFIDEQDYVNIFCQGYNLLPWQPDI